MGLPFSRISYLTLTIDAKVSKSGLRYSSKSSDLGMLCGFGVSLCKNGINIHT